MITDTLEIHGTLQGPMWWPIGEPSQRPFHVAYHRDYDSGQVWYWRGAAQEVEGVGSSMADIVAHLDELLQSDGDFSGPVRLTADSLVEVRRVDRAASTITRTRVYGVVDWPSLSDVVDVDAFPFECEP